ncbi:MAG: MIP family channel protein [Chloroflexota bacterium]
MDSKKLTAEFIGTFILIFIGAGAGVMAGAGAGNLVSVAFAHGLVIVALAYAYGDISGLHINPAVTIGLLVGGKIDPTEAAGYIVAQILGGIVGAAALFFAVNGFVDVSASGLGNTVPADGVGVVQALVVEILLTFFLVNTIYHAAVSGKAGNMAPVAIGLTLAFSIMMGGPLTGASLNPARTVGPAIITGNFSALWVYLVGPPIGGVLAALLHGFMRSD